MKKIQYVKLVGLLTILLFLNISCKDDDTLLRGSDNTFAGTTIIAIFAPT